MRLKAIIALILLCCVWCAGQEHLTVYNQNFAVVKEKITLELDKGENRIMHTGMSRSIEPSSVILRQLSDDERIIIKEQHYIPTPPSQHDLLKKYEGRTLTLFLLDQGQGMLKQQAKLLRAPLYQIKVRTSNNYNRTLANDVASVWQTDDGIIFGSPGKYQVAFPEDALTDEIIQASLIWEIVAPAENKYPVELNYITHNLRWYATYNCTADADSDEADMTAWVRVINTTGRDFNDVSLSLVAGSPNRSISFGNRATQNNYGNGGRAAADTSATTFDEYKIFDIPELVDMADASTLQLTLISPLRISGNRYYVYDGMRQTWDLNNRRYSDEPSYGSGSTANVWTFLQIPNIKEKGLGLPMPRGQWNYYRTRGDGVEFTGQDFMLDTPVGEDINLFLGASFDLIGTRKQTAYKKENQSISESIEIKLRNHKQQDVEVRVVEHLWRYANWEVTEKSHEFSKQNSGQIEFRVPVTAGGETVITYQVKYSR